jgi:hypothetical protein
MPDGELDTKEFDNYESLFGYAEANGCTIVVWGKLTISFPKEPL